MKTKVAVAMSGGVDSSVAAYLLKERGYEVIGLTMQLESNSVCCGLSDISDAGKVAHHLGIRHYVVNFREAFRQYVMADFIEEYSRGRTPNPCIRCNKYIKFDFLLRRAREIGADFLATGHYSRLVPAPDGDKFFLKRGVDTGKDQSYVLYVLNQQSLKNILLPLGEMTKEEVREIARREKLPVAHKPESQEICFVSGDYRAFLEKELSFMSQPGAIVNTRGEVLGRHRGIASFTIGQRRGIGLSSGKPLYVLGLNSQKNEVVVGTRDEGYSQEFMVEESNFISGDKLESEIEALVKIRYLHSPFLASIIPLEGETLPLTGESLRVIFKEPQWGITPGQSAVFYHGDIVLGGGIIKNIDFWSNLDIIK